MTDKTPDEVLELARQRIEWRKETERMEATQARKTRMEREAPWRYAFFGLLGTLILGLLFTPGIPMEQKMLLVLQGVCSQEHNIILGGLQLPMCARCSGIYISTVVAFGYALLTGRARTGRMPPWSINAALLLLVAVMGVDGINSTLETLGLPTAYTPRNDLRTLTGIGVGTGIGITMLVMFNLALRGDVDQEQRVLDTWREFALLLVVNFLIVVAIFGNLEFLAWPLAVIVFVGVVGVLFAVNLLFASMFMGYEGNISRFDQLVKPATFALLATVVMLAALSMLRGWLEVQAGV
jgi:uncharacterized membrane protein